jgi:glutamate-5-semialdehyde dehydrogenase
MQAAANANQVPDQHQTLVDQLCLRARAASLALAQAPTAQKNLWLKNLAAALRSQTTQLAAANAQDLAAATGLSAAMRDRLTLTPARIEAMAGGLEQLVELPDPVGRVREERRLPSGVHVQKVGVPLGVVLFIYESRPNVTIDAAGLCVKSGNAIILRGGSEAHASNRALVELCRAELEKSGLPADAVQQVPVTDRAVVGCLLAQGDRIDVVVPRGGEDLVRRVSREARMPVLRHYTGNCHMFLDADADPAMASSLVLDSKCSRPGVCNALETLLVHGEWAQPHLSSLLAVLREKGVEIRGCPRVVRMGAETGQPVVPARDADWDTEFLDLILAVKVVDSLEDAVAHIQKHSSGHTEAIVTGQPPRAEEFLRRVDSAAVMVNASTRLHDGGELGLGAEIGISTGKFHARGPCGLEELASYKYVVRGTGQTRV